MLVWILGPKSVERAYVLHQPDGVGSQRHHIVPYGELNGVSIALMASTILSDYLVFDDVAAIILEEENRCITTGRTGKPVQAGGGLGGDEREVNGTWL
ncbi:hypothetical protein Tco_0786400 [Tanacetum coccineum]